MIELPPCWADVVGASMFQLGPSVFEKAVRPVLVYLFLVILLRLFGKRELAQLNPFDLIVLLSLSNTLQNAIIGDDNSVTGGLIGAFSLCGFNYLVVRFLFRHRRLDQIIQGNPAALIRDGRVCHRALARELITTADLLSIIRRQGYTAIHEVKSCVLQPGGAFEVEGKHPPRADSDRKEILARLEVLSTQVAELVRELRSRGENPF